MMQRRRNDPELLATLRLRVADNGSNIAELDVHYGNTLREHLRRVVADAP